MRVNFREHRILFLLANRNDESSADHRSGSSNVRQETIGCSHVNHLNNAGASLMPDAITKSMVEHLTLESQIGGYEAAAKRNEELAKLYASAATLLNAKPTNIAFTANATDAFTRALSSIPFRSGDVILTSNDDYISNQIQYLSLQKRLGIRIERAQSLPTGGVDLNDLERKLKQHHPKLVAITHIPTNSGLVQPVYEIGEIVAKYDTVFLLDACQSVGQLPMDVKRIKCDFLSATSRKFLRGPRGAGFLYVSDKALEAGLEPLFLDMRGAEWVEKDQYVPRADATRFEDWEFAYALQIGTRVAMDYAQRIGIDRIWNRVHQLADFTRTELTQLAGVRVLDRGPELGGLVTFTTPADGPDKLVSGLLKRGINSVASYRGYAVIDFDDKAVQWAVRLSPHYFNTVEEIRSAVRAVDEINRQG